MKDIDFDELDRAVSSVLNQKTVTTDGPATTDTSAEAPHSTTAVASTAVAAAPSTTIAEETPVAVAADESTAMTADPVPAETDGTPPATPLAVRRRGKFMDVMHPSHDMAPGTSTPTPQPTPTRRSIAPLSPASEIVPEEKEEVSTSTETEVEAATPSVTEPAAPAEPVSTDSSYVDPLDFMKKDDEAPEETSEPAVAAESVETMPDPLDTATPELTEEKTPTPPPVAPSTPFLTDTQVEKRPLGAFGDDEATAFPAPSEGEAEPASDETAPQETDTTPTEETDTQTAPAVPLPRELQPDVVKVEAIQDDTQSPEAVPAGVVDAVAESAASHPLFDTSTYHEPTAAKSGKKIPGWLLWLIGFLICLIVGAGVGYFLFSAGL